MVIDGAGSAYQVGNCAGVTPVPPPKNAPMPRERSGLRHRGRPTSLPPVRTYAPWQKLQGCSHVKRRANIQLPLLGLGFGENHQTQ